VAQDANMPTAVNATSVRNFIIPLTRSKNACRSSA
jgi:hypothetical protein